MSEGFEASYDVEARGIRVGEAQRTISRCGDDCFRFRSEAEPRGLLRLFRNGPLIEESQWRMRAGELRPERYLYSDLSGSKPEHTTVTFDWTAGLVKARGHREWEEELPAGTLDPLSFQVALMRALAQGADEVAHPVAERRRLTHYRFVREAKETLNTPLGDVETVRLRRVRDDSKRETRIWCAPAFGYLPVRLEQEERDGTLVRLKIRSVAGLAAADNPQ